MLHKSSPFYEKCKSRKTEQTGGKQSIPEFAPRKIKIVKNRVDIEKSM